MVQRGLIYAMLDRIKDWICGEGGLGMGWVLRWDRQMRFLVVKRWSFGEGWARDMAFCEFLEVEGE